MGLVSVVVPTVGARDLSPTLDSLARQTYDAYEVITVLDEQRRGAPWARNQGEKKATGEYILFLDDDIVLDPEFLREMVRALTRDPSSAYAYCHYERLAPFNDISRAGPFDARRLRSANFISTMSLMRHEAFIPWDERIRRFQDWDMWLSLLAKGRTGVFVDRVLFIATYHGERITTTDERETRRLARKVRLKHGMVRAVGADVALEDRQLTSAQGQEREFTHIADSASSTMAGRLSGMCARPGARSGSARIVGSRPVFGGGKRP